MPTVKSVPRVSRTINPLHFEDLEPHRFEDLIRQLAYNFRPWRFLEATGRMGQDEGVDIRGLEVLTNVSANDVLSDTDADEELQESTFLTEREWRIQCKRYKTIRPKLMRQIVAEAVPDLAEPPYGLIVAAACDVSAQTIAAFHDERLKRGTAVGHLWTKAHLEDLLFQPQNDHLLFAYFGISLQTRQRSRLQRIQSEMSLKRKILRAFKVENFSELSFAETLIRDFAFEGPLTETLPPDQANDFSRLPPWFTARILHAYSRGLVIQRFIYDGWIKDDGSWDFLPGSARQVSWIGNDFIRDRRNEGSWQRDSEISSAYHRLYELVPEQERCSIKVACLLSFDAIVEIDPIGQPYFEGVHLYCRFGAESGPFESGIMLSCSKSTYDHREISWATHKPLLGPLLKSNLDIEGAELITFWSSDKEKDPVRKKRKQKKGKDCG